MTTVVASTLNILKPKMGNEIEDYTAINMWYKELDARYNFSVGPTVVALSTSEQLQELDKLDPPYMTSEKLDLPGMSKYIDSTCFLSNYVFIHRRRMGSDYPPTPHD